LKVFCEIYFSWEEGSPTPVLHIGWAKHMVATCAKFSPATRAGIQVEPEDEDDGDDGDRDEDEPATGKLIYSSSLSPSSVLAHGEDNNNYYKKCDTSEKPSSTSTATVCDNFDSQSVKATNNDVRAKTNDVTNKTNDVRVRYDDVRVKNYECQNETLIEKLSNSCAMQIFNIDFLLGKTSQPFLESCNPKTFQDPSKRVKNPIIRIDNPSTKQSLSDPTPKILVKLNSAKMRGLRNLLCAEKLNTSAITLQMTAQSQTDVTSHHRKSTDDAGSSRSKRPRRD
jgi:menin